MKNQKAIKTNMAKDIGDIKKYHGYPDPVALGRVMAEVMEQSQPIIQKFIERYQANDPRETVFDPFNVQDAAVKFLEAIQKNPEKYIKIQADYWNQSMDLWSNTMMRFLGEDQTPSAELDPGKIEPEKGDRRFRSPLWQDSTIFDYFKQSYLLTNKAVHQAIESTEGIDAQTKQRIDFAARQYLDAISPTNFLFTNPEVLQETLETGGENLVKGLKNLLEDLERGNGELKISITDYDAFKVGENLATTPGKVIYENDLMQLIQYTPATETVFEVPVLVVPPWINKYYILDLKPENSFVKWLTEKGFTVFTISWVNPDAKLAQKKFEDYMQEGILGALDAIESITNQKKTNVIGYCLGGTLLSITLGYLKQKKQDQCIASATYLTTLIDFEEAGELKMFTDDTQLQLLDKEMSEKGFLAAKSLQKTFSLLRANDMIWSFVINNYLMGREPFPFDLLYWNDDSTNMPAAMHRFYLKAMYRENRLKEPGGISMKGEPIDISKVTTPSYFLSTREDHIAPWKATYAGAKLMKGDDIVFTLAASGHVAGVVNPPLKNKYCYWTSKQRPDDPEDWFNATHEEQGSWWPHWEEWVQKYAGKKVAPPKTGNQKYKAIENAPGRYVKVKGQF